MQESILMVASTEKGIALLQSLIPPGSADASRVCQSGGEARRAMVEQEYKAVLINTPLSDESGLDLSLEVVRQTTAAVLLLVRAELAEAVFARVEEQGVLVVAKPVIRQMFEQSLRCGLAARNRVLALQAENRRLETKMAELKLVDRAKCLLIQYRGVTEEQAHRMIEKTAMDRRMTKAAVARDILVSYED